MPQGYATLRRWNTAAFGAFLLGGAAGVVCLPAPAEAQDIPVRELLEVDARSADGFTRVSGVRELQDGRVVLVDSHERLVRILSPDLSAAEVLSGHGEGPGEYLMPGPLFALEGGRTAVFDEARSGFLVVHPDGSMDGPLRAGRAAGVGVPRRMDGSGAFYARGRRAGPGSEGEFAGLDSAAVQRWHPETESWDTVAFVPGARGLSTLARDRAPFRPRFLWSVGEDGGVAIVRPDPYRVRLVTPEGSGREGAPVPYDTIPLSEDHKEAWRQRQGEPRPTISGVRGQEGTQVRMSRWPVSEPDEWPENLPPYVNEGPYFAPDGTLWVARTVRAGDLAAFDVFDRDGALDHRARLPAGSRLVGFGEGSVYVVQKDAVDLEYVVRIRR